MYKLKVLCSEFWSKINEQVTLSIGYPFTFIKYLYLSANKENKGKKNKNTHVYTKVVKMRKEAHLFKVIVK